MTTPYRDENEFLRMRVAELESEIKKYQQKSNGIGFDTFILVLAITASLGFIIALLFVSLKWTIISYGLLCVTCAFTDDRF